MDRRNRRGERRDRQHRRDASSTPALTALAVVSRDETASRTSLRADATRIDVVLSTAIHAPFWRAYARPGSRRHSHVRGSVESAASAWASPMQAAISRYVTLTPGPIRCVCRLWRGRVVVIEAVESHDRGRRLG
jgi:hypothetical protein